MDGLWLFAAVLLCPLTMGLMMLFMMRGKRGGAGAGDEGGDNRQ